MRIEKYEQDYEAKVKLALKKSGLLDNRPKSISWFFLAALIAITFLGIYFKIQDYFPMVIAWKGGRKFLFWEDIAHIPLLLWIGLLIGWISAAVHDDKKKRDWESKVKSTAKKVFMAGMESDNPDDAEYCYMSINNYGLEDYGLSDKFLQKFLKK